MDFRGDQWPLRKKRLLRRSNHTGKTDFTRAGREEKTDSTAFEVPPWIAVCVRHWNLCGSIFGVQQTLQDNFKGLCSKHCVQNGSLFWWSRNHEAKSVQSVPCGPLHTFFCTFVLFYLTVRFCYWLSQLPKCVILQVCANSCFRSNSIHEPFLPHSESSRAISWKLQKCRAR